MISTCNKCQKRVDRHGNGHGMDCPVRQQILRILARFSERVKEATDTMSRVVAVYCDGGLVGRNPSDIGGTWAWCGVDKDGNRIVEESGFVAATATRKVTNNHTEQIAICKALEALPDGWSGTVYTDSNCALKRVFRGATTYNLPRNIKARCAAAVRRLGRIEAVLLEGHPSKADLERGYGKKHDLPVSEHNVWCDKACTREAEKVKNEKKNKEA